MNKCFIGLVTIAFAFVVIIGGCKKEDPNYYETGTPAFAVYQKEAEPEAFYAYCASHDIFLDSVYVTSPINIKSKLYYHGTAYAREIHFLIGDTFIPHTGNWTFVFYGRRAVNNTAFHAFVSRQL